MHICNKLFKGVDKNENGLDYNRPFLIEIVEGMWCDIGYTWNGTDFGQPQ